MLAVTEVSGVAVNVSASSNNIQGQQIQSVKYTTTQQQAQFISTQMLQQQQQQQNNNNSNTVSNGQQQQLLQTSKKSDTPQVRQVQQYQSMVAMGSAGQHVLVKTPVTIPMRNNINIVTTSLEGDESHQNDESAADDKPKFILAPTPAQLGKAPRQKRISSSGEYFNTLPSTIDSMYLYFSYASNKILKQLSAFLLHTNFWEKFIR